MIDYATATSDHELEEILALQQKNLPRALLPEEREKEGFVTVVHSIGTLRAMNAVCPHIVAKADGKVVGYALCMHPRFAADIPVLKPMFDKIEGLHPPINNYIAMGQICIDKAFRKRGIFRKLYETMQAKTKKDFSRIITEIDARNTRSLQAHYTIGFKEVHTYTSGGQEWKIVSFP